MYAALELTPEQQAARERRRDDPFPPKPDWTPEALAELNDTKPVHYDGGDYPAVRRPMFTPADAAAEEYVGRFTQRIWALARAGHFGEARRLAAQWGMPRGPQHRPAPGSRPYYPPPDGPPPWRGETGPQPGFPQPYTPVAGGVAEAVSGLPSIPVHKPLAPMALAPVRERRAEVARHRLDRLPDAPAYDGYPHAEEWAARMRSVGLATGTHTELEDPAAWDRPVTDSAGPPPVRRGLAITAGLPRRLAATGGQRGGRHAAPGTPGWLAGTGTPPAGQQPALRFRDVDAGLLERVRDRLASLPERQSA